jgi:hypothetical protein
MSFETIDLSPPALESPPELSPAPASPEVLRGRPYVKVRIRDADSMPAVLSQHVSSADWDLFWMKLQPIAAQAEWYNGVFVLVAGALFISYFVTMVIMMTLSILLSYVTVGIFGLVALAEVLLFMYWNRSVRKSQLDALQAISKAEQERFFGKCGWTVECELKPEDSGLCGLCGFYLFLIPNQNQFTPTRTVQESRSMEDSNLRFNDDSALQAGGYLRIRLCKDHFYSWTPICLPYLETFRTMPSELLQSPFPHYEIANLWGSFWSDLVMQSRFDLRWHRIKLVSYILWITWLMSNYTLMDVSVPWYPRKYAGLVALVPLMLYYYASNCVAWKVGKLVQHQTAEFIAHGMLIEIRCAYDFPDGCRMVRVCHLYVFPVSVSERQTGVLTGMA